MRSTLHGRCFYVIVVRDAARWLAVYVELSETSGSITRVFVPLVSWPITTLSIILVILSVLIAATILLHRSRGGGMSDLFGGGMSTSMGGVSTAERRLDTITVWLGAVWFLTIIGLLVVYYIEY